MAEFDAELYLRLTGERDVLDHKSEDGPPGSAELGAAAHALVAVGAVPAERAQAIVDDYHLALSYRPGEHHRHRLRGQRPPRAHGSLGPLRAVPCGRQIEQPWGELSLSYVVLSGEATVLHVSMRPAPSPPGPSRQATRASRQAILRTRVTGAAPGPGRRSRPGIHGHLIGAGLPGQLTLTDDRGTISTGDFSGSGSDSGWRGQFDARPPLAVDTAWIELLGERIDMPGPPGRGAEVRIEPRPDGDPARGYLWAKLASLAESQSADAIETPIEALVAAGALAADDPDLAELRAVATSLFAGPRTTPAFRAALPEPWRTMMGRRGRAGGPDGLVVVGAATPPFDGVAVAVLAVRSGDERFSAEVEVVPALHHWHGFQGGVDGPMLAWWARDDLGHHYLGQQDSWHSGLDRSGGEIGFWPALDPAAQVLDIMPTTMAARAVIGVPLDWVEEL